MENQLPLFYGLSFLTAALAFAFAAYLYLWVKKQPTQNERIIEVSALIKAGANTFMRREYRILATFAGVAAVIFDVVLTMAGQIIGRKRAVPIVTLAGAFIASWFFDVHILLILLACALIGLAQWRADTKKGAAA